MKTYVLQVIAELESSPNWAVTFVRRRMEFHKKFSDGKIFSTAHGAEFFTNVLSCLNGAKWNPDEEIFPKSEYEENFRKMILRHKS